jgi:RNA polymerase sigma factor (sigma-70 family)
MPRRTAPLGRANTSPVGGIHAITMPSTVDSTAAALAHEPGLRRLALSLAAPHDAEDLVQSTWIRALEQRATQVHFPAAWLRRILRNERHMALRSSRRGLAREQAFAALADEPEDPECTAARRELARILAELVDDLDDDAREIVCQRYFQDKSAVEIAREQAIPAGTVRWRLKTAMDRLRAQLDARYGGRRSTWAAVMLTVPRALTPATASPVLAKTLAIAMGTVAVVAAHGLDAPEDRPRDAIALASASDTPAQARRRDVPRATEEARAHWAARVDGIRASHARERSSAAAAGKPASGVLGCDDASCITTLAADLAELVHGCEDFVDGLPADVRMVARIVGAPDIGTVVESVSLEGVPSAPADLTECLTESMVALDLPPVSEPLEEEITIALHAMAGLGLAVPSEAAAPALVTLDDDDAAAVLSAHGVGLPEGAVVRVFSTER